MKLIKWNGMYHKEKPYFDDIACEEVEMTRSQIRKIPEDRKCKICFPRRD